MVAVVRDALRDWTQKRNARQQQGIDVRQVWRQAMEDKSPGVPVKQVRNASDIVAISWTRCRWIPCAARAPG